MFKRLSFRQLFWPILVFGLLLIPHLGLQNYVYDDSYIHIRIANHLAQYGQPYFNIGEPVNASSSPVWTILVAAVMFLARFHLVVMAIMGAIISTLGVIGFLALLSSEAPLSPIDRFIFGAMYLAITLPSSIGWMETPLALLVMSVALLRYKRDRVDAFLLFGLAPFIRLEFAALYAIVFCDAVLRKKMPIGHLVGWSLAGSAPFVIYELYFFGTIIPNTIVAKSIVYSLSYKYVFDTLVSGLIPGISFWLPMNRILEGIRWWIIGPAILSVATYFLFRAGRSLSFLFLTAIGFGGIVVAAYLAARVLVFEWYLPIYLVPLLIGLYVSLKRPGPPIIKYGTWLLAAPMLALWILAFIQICFSSFRPELYPDVRANARTRSYLQIGRELYQKYPQARLMASEIGALGYSFPGYILDGEGLATPSALKYHPLRVPAQRSGGDIGAIPRDFIEAEQPEIIVSMPPYIEHFMKKGDSSDYVLFLKPVYLAEDAAYLGPSLYGSPYINVYLRRDILAQAPTP